MPLTLTCRALGTALEWPEAKKKAGLVRQWGIEVCTEGSRRTRSDHELLEHPLITQAATTCKLEASQRERTRCPALGR